MDRATLRKVEADQDETTRNAADPGKLKEERTWTEWEVKIENYLSTIPWVTGVPLSYVVRAQAAPDCTTDSQGDFIAEIIACTPLSGAQFQVDKRKVHQLLKNYLMAETSGQWISSTEKAQMLGKTLMNSAAITAVKEISSAASQLQIDSERHCIIRASVYCPSTRF